MSRQKLRMLWTKFCVQWPLLHVLRQNLASEEAKIFKVFFWIFNGENPLFTKSSQKMVQFQKINKKNFLNSLVSEKKFKKNLSLPCGTTDRWYSMEIETKWNKSTQSAPFRKQNKRSSFFKCFFTFFIVLKLTFHLFDRSGDTC